MSDVMDQSGDGSENTDGAAPEQVAADAAGDGTAAGVTGEAPVTRRRVLSGGATALIAATTAAVTLGEASNAFASTEKKGKAGESDSTKKSPKKPLQITVNGKLRTVTYSPGTMLLYVLRDEFHLRGPKFGCGLSECGACAVLLNGKQIRSCVTAVSSVANQDIVTLDGLAATWHGKSGTAKAKPGQLHPLQQAWIDEQVPQCGYCQAGMIIQAADLLSTNPKPTTAEIKQNMNGHLCRCGTYNGIARAIHRAAEEMAK
jgi:isoquinoline 1-oxidoreductase subunit alpha